MVCTCEQGSGQYILNNTVTQYPGKILKISLNPVENRLKISILAEKSKGEIHLRDINGKIVFDKKFDTNNVDYYIDVSEYKQGVYLLSIVDGDMIYNK